MAGAGTTGAGPPGGGTLLWRATVDDKTGDFFVQFEGNLRKLTGGSNAAFQNISQGGTKAAAATGALVGIFAGLTAAVTTFAVQAARQALRVFEQLVFSSAQLAARAETLQVVMYTVGNNVGYTRAELDALEVSITALGITTIAARQILSEMAETGLELADSVKLARIAQDAAVIADINSSEAMMRMIHGIATLNPLVLRRMGLIVSLNQAYQKYAATMGISYEALNTETRQMIATHAVEEAGTRIAGAYNAAMATTGKLATSVARFMQEFLTVLGEGFKPAYGVYIRELIRNLQNMTDWLRTNKEDVQKFGETLGRVFGATIQTVEKLATSLSKIPGHVLAAGEALADMLAPLTGQTTEDVDKSMSDLGRNALLVFTSFVAVSVTFIDLIGEGVHEIFDYLLQLVKGLGFAFQETGFMFTNMVDQLKQGIPIGAAIDDTVAKVGEMTRAFQENNEFNKEWGDRLDDVGRTIEARYETLVIAIGTSIGLFPDIAKKAAAPFNALLERLRILESEEAAATDKIVDLNARMMQELLDLNKQAARDIIDTGIERSREVEAAERGYQRKIEDIWRDYNKRKLKLTTGTTDEEEADRDKANERRVDEELRYSRKLEDIEIGFQRKLADIKEDALAQMDEAARTNDAVAMARAMREAQRQLKDAAKNRDRDREDAALDHKRNLDDIVLEQQKEREQRKKDRAQELEDLEKDLQDQLAEAARSRDQEQEDRVRSWAEADADKVRHDAWEKEDREIKWKAEIKQLAFWLGQRKELTAQNVLDLLAENAPFLVKDQTFWGSYYSAHIVDLKAHIKNVIGEWTGLFELLRKARQLSLTDGGTVGTTPNLPQIYPGENEAPSPWPTSFKAAGGLDLIRNPTRVTFAEHEPEIVASLPLSRVVTHNINMRGGINVTGVSPQMESNMEGALMDILNQFGQSILAKQGAYS